MGGDLVLLHAIYGLFVLLIIGFMAAGRDTSLVSILGIFALGLAATGSLITAVTGIFSGFIYAITELLPTILVICVIVAMSRVLAAGGIHETMVRPAVALLRNPFLAYWGIGIIMLIVSWFFWPSPAVALIGAVLLPAAVRAGLPAMGVAVAMNLFGHGIALSGDYVVQGAPTLTAKAAGIPVIDVIHASIPLVAVMGVVTTVTAYLLLRRDMKRGSLETAILHDDGDDTAQIKRPPALARVPRLLLAITVPAAFVLDIAAMFLFDLRGGEATALVGGTSLALLLVIALATHRGKGLEQATQYLIHGFQFGWRVFGPVIPIAAFFYLGDSGFARVLGDVLPAGSQGLVNDMGAAMAQAIPVSKEVAAVALTGVGVITGLDGSGFSGITLAGSVAQLFSVALGSGIATLTALGQVAAIWVGGGTLVPWALIPAAAICGVTPFELARRNLIPVSVGLAVTTLVAMLLI